MIQNNKYYLICSISALTLLAEHQEGHLAWADATATHCLLLQ